MTEIMFWRFLFDFLVGVVVGTGIIIRNTKNEE